MRRERLRLCILVIMALAVFPVTSFAQKKPYEGITIRWLCDAGHQQTPAAIQVDHAKKALGINIELIPELEDTHYQLVMKDWTLGGGSYDIVDVRVHWNADLMGSNGYFLPLNQYIEKFNAWEHYRDIIETFRRLYCEREGKIYAFAQDGDLAIMYYRKDILGNPEYQKKFKEKYGYNLPVPPDTWDELGDVAKFFTGWDWNGDGKVEYGLSFSPWLRGFVDRWFPPMWGSVSGGKVLFDKNMNPLINSNDGVKTLKLMKSFLPYMPPGFLSLTWAETFALFLEGEVPIILTYGDIGRLVLEEKTFGGRGGAHYRGKIGYASSPATIIGGKKYRYNPMAGGRVIAISKFCKNPEAAFAVVLEFGKKERSILHVSNTLSGSDPFAYSHMDITNWKT